MERHICQRCGHLWGEHGSKSCLAFGCCCGRSRLDADKHNNQDANARIATLEAQLAAEREAVRVLGARCNVLQMLVAIPVKYQVHSNGVKCGCCGIYTFDLHENDDGWLDISKASHSTNCLVHIANITKQKVLANPIASAAITDATKARKKREKT